ncbi:hypothetical protein HII36_22770 [Nonomuraea sp. NN258]|uniref:hypothetical protein n=1 Tax=Nonomuraea antri TaxID=2730852 RepID=UPI001568F2F6|nr:hypothetical protein [Nonomuraea antri]NRQ34637.1 hypothetical protein [Nonomuraea antri]
MGTDIYGYLEARHPSADEDWFEWDAWSGACIPLYPLYDGRDYDAFTCLFGVRDRLGRPSVAAGRGLPADASQPVRADYESTARLDPAVHGCTWISWTELRDLDLGRPEYQSLGPGTGWEHVFAVMRALAGRFGPDGVRLVVWFD